MKDDNFIIIAVDGGAASGKSSTSKLLSKRLNLLYVNTGSHYRTLTWAILKAGYSVTDVDPIVSHLKAIDIGTRIEGKEAHITLDKRIPGQEIRSEQVNEAVSIVAAIPEVRLFLLTYQRSYEQLAREAGFSGLIMEGRDIGSIIFPDADFRFFMSADEGERTRRRRLEGQIDSIQKRDQLDTKRKTAPLTYTEGAILVDTTYLSLNEVADKMTSLIHLVEKTDPKPQENLGKNTKS
ncbi:MAG: (d)CMP kinase [Verrucomicrobia bacterium]|nr:(d)CMP kinase [Verrucomicrobiota bacterium]MDA1065196.1 (d)CMP kinase [Verrucomicrobiota bacterium]